MPSGRTNPVGHHHDKVLVIDVVHVADFSRVLAFLTLEGEIGACDSRSLCLLVNDCKDTVFARKWNSPGILSCGVGCGFGNGGCLSARGCPYPAPEAGWPAPGPGRCRSPLLRRTGRGRRLPDGPRAKKQQEGEISPPCCRSRASCRVVRRGVSISERDDTADVARRGTDIGLEGARLGYPAAGRLVVEPEVLLGNRKLHIDALPGPDENLLEVF